MNLAFTSRNRSCSWTSVCCLFGLSLWVFFSTTDCFAGVGMGEWTIETPGKNLIADSDLFEDQGVCLHRPAADDGILDDKAVFVSHIQWWMYFEGHVVGKATKGFFIFDERLREARFFDKQTDLDVGLTKLKLGKALSKRLTPQDGWNSSVGVVLIEMCKKRLSELKTGTGEAKNLGPAERESLKESTEQYLKMLQAQVAAADSDQKGVIGAEMDAEDSEANSRENRDS